MPDGPIKDPYSGQHEDSIYAVWHDPTTYDLLRHGPPYLPDQAKVASDPRVVKAACRPMVEKTSADALTTLSIIIQHIKADFGPTPMSEMAALLAFVRAESLVHQAHHWQTRGESYYADHLMFDRLYTELVPMIDTVAERMVGSGHHILAHPVLHTKHVSAIVQSFYDGAPVNPTPDDYVALSLRAVLHTLVVLKIVYGVLEETGRLSHGIDNLIQGVADRHEEHVYLLKQRSQHRTASYDKRQVAANDSRWKST